MPGNPPDRPDRFARRHALPERAAAAAASREHGMPRPEPASGSVYGEGAAEPGEAAGARRAVRASAPVPHPGRPAAVVRTPLAARPEAGTGREIRTREWSGPVSFVIGTRPAGHSPRLLRETVAGHGAPAAAVRSTGEEVPAAAERTAPDAGVRLAAHPAGQVHVHQSAAGGFRGGPAGPAAGGTLSDPAFVIGRFTALPSRRPVHTEESAHV
ncbi:hypothetical protein [Streptomyces sp. CAU 1734]|uniref:hypothetical protein n=1 Tax=Streptomyces sp. CAU 1734 TaxID=3140360 RepID=UPI003260A1B5